MPVFGSILAVLFLGETFYLYHAVGIALIAAGILLASVRGASGESRQRLIALLVRRWRGA
jgi:drug/metabolite transporter (DMT)-like permease